MFTCSHELRLEHEAIHNGINIAPSRRREKRPIKNNIEGSTEHECNSWISVRASARTSGRGSSVSRLYVLVGMKRIGEMKYSTYRSSLCNLFKKIT